MGDNEGNGFTVLAPTNNAFNALGPVEVTTEELQQILLYHVIGAEVPASVVVTLSEAETLQGSDISIAVQDGSVIINDSATVTWTDLQTTNGIIHVINAVLIP